MSKAIQGLAVLGGAAVLGAFTLGVGGAVLEGLMNTATGFETLVGVAATGLSMEAGAIADALTSNRGQNITTRAQASFRQTIYGTQRVGGVEIYRSTTGSTHNQFNYVIVIAGHECWAIQNLYLDGRQVYFNVGSGGNTTRNGYNFGGSASGGDHTGADGSTYNFGGLVYCEARYGTQLPGDIITGLTANDPKWAASASGTPYVGGCTYVYLKVVHNDNMFPGEPEIRFTVMGKPVFDPRTSQTTYSDNWALIVNDVLSGATSLLGETVNQAQLVAAANVCDEYVPLAAGGSERRYSCHYHYDESSAAGDVLGTMMSAAAGRLSRINGEWFIWPAYFQGASASFDASALTDTIQWMPKRSYRDLINRVNGTYIAPNYPYNASGNLYDSNGWYQGTIQNNFPFAFQPTNYPSYAADVLHGYASDEFLNEDGGVPLPKEISQQCVLSVAQVQRVAKIYLFRNRQQGSGSFTMSLAAYCLQPCDTFNFTFPQNGWADKLLEVNSVSLRMDAGGQGRAPQFLLDVGVNETNASVYEWSTAEELTVYDVPASPSQTPYTPVAPANMTVISSAATALRQPDGSVVPRIEVTWDTPLDGLVRSIQMQYQLVGDATWTDAGSVDVSLNNGFISGIVAGQTYSVRIRSVRSTGAASPWVTINGTTAGLVISVLSQDGVGIGSLVGEAYTNGAASIYCEPFNAYVGQYTIPIFPRGGMAITGLSQQTLYYVFYVDPTTAGGDVTPIATTNRQDFLNKGGYFLIDSIVTGYAAPPSGGGGTGGGGGSSTPSSRYYPSSFQDLGSRSTSNASAAYDGDTSTCARVSGASDSSSYADGDCVFQGFPSLGSPNAATLSVVASYDQRGSGNTGQINVTINGTTTTLVTGSASPIPSTTYTATIPANVPFSSVSIEVIAEPAQSSGGDDPEPQPTNPGDPQPQPIVKPITKTATATVSVYEIFITT